MTTTEPVRVLRPSGRLRAPNDRPPSTYYEYEEPTVFDRRPELLDVPSFGATWASAVRSNA